MNPAAVGILSGPNLAVEIMEGQPAATVIAMGDPASAARIQPVFNTPRFRVYTNPDVVGVELAGAIKNVIAIAAGMSTGLGFGMNTMATLVTRGLAEMTRLGIALGGQALTFGGLAGGRRPHGDLREPAQPQQPGGLPTGPGTRH